MGGGTGGGAAGAGYEGTLLLLTLLALSGKAGGKVCEPSPKCPLT